MKKIFSAKDKFQYLIPALLITALLLRIPLLNSSFWLDEAAQALESARPFSQQLDIIPDFQPPLLHYIVHFAMLAGSNEWWLRLWGALIPGLITLIASYFIGKKLINNTTGLLASLLMTTSSFHVFYSQELRPYSLAAMWAALSWLVMINIWQQHSQPQANSLQADDLALKSDFTFQPVRRQWLFYCLFTILGLYSSYTYPFVTLSQLIITLCLYRSILKQHLLSGLISALFFLPWLPMFLKQLSTGTALRANLPGWETVVSLPQLQALPLTIGKLVFGVIRLDVSVPFIAVSAALTLLTMVLLLPTFIQQNSVSLKTKLLKLLSIFKIDKISQPTVVRRSLILIFLAGALQLLTGWLISFLVPVVRPKRFLFVQPFIYLLVSAAISLSFKSKQLLMKILAVILLAGFMTVNIFSLNQYYRSPELQRENWQHLQHTIQARFPEQETILVFAFDEPFAPWRWYDQQQFPTLAIDNIQQRSYSQVVDELKPIFDYQYVLVFEYLTDLTDPDDYLIRGVEDLGYQYYETIDQINIGFVRVYLKDTEAVTG